MKRFNVKINRYLCAIAITMLSVASPCNLFSQDEQAVIFDKILKSQDARKAAYDTGHFVWIKTDKHNSGQVSVSKYEYWALNGKYYRLDVSVSDNGNTDNLVKRGLTITRPEGFGIFHFPTDNGPGTLRDFGTSEGGKAKIFGAYTFQRADRLGLDYLNSIIRLKANDTEIKDLRVSKGEGNDYIVSYSRTHHEGEQLYHATLDGRDYRVLSWEYRGLGNDGVRKTHQTATYHYGNSQLHSPVEVSEIVDANFDVGLIATHIKLIEYDSSPPPIEKFALAGLGHSTEASPTIWTRRLVLFVIGFSLLVGYYCYRTRKAVRQS